MRVIVAGLGVQGHKRRKVAGTECVATVDPVNPEADFRAIGDVPLESYDAVLACIPDGPKIAFLNYCVDNSKHVLVEKPLWAEQALDIEALGERVRSRKLTLYTAYNHRFEPHFIRMRNLIASDVLGRIYSCRMFYGNGTARLVSGSTWRDHGAGVLSELGSHLLDTCRFWFGDIGGEFVVTSANCFENRAPDHVVISNENARPRIQLEMTLLMWRNHFTCDVLAERGSAHISSLCKWGPSTFTHRARVLPSGRPTEQRFVLVEEDSSWMAEYEHFKSLCASKAESDLSADVWLHRSLSRMSVDAIRMAERAS